MTTNGSAVLQELVTGKGTWSAPPSIMVAHRNAKRWKNQPGLINCNGAENSCGHILLATGYKAADLAGNRVH